MPLTEELRIGTELRGYRVEELAGRGGMGAVYRATDIRLRRQVALKVIAPHLAQDERFRRRFLAESEVATSLEHPHILPVYDAGEANGSLYIAMRYVEESDLRRMLHEEGPLTPARTLQLLGEVADALDTAHARGLIHRDVKPSNILISGHGDTAHSYLADFGLTQRTGEGEAAGGARLAGTVDYMAPEQIERDEVDGRADVYALGCVLYECLTGEVPFPLESDLAVLWAHMRATPPRASERNAALPKAIDRVIERALAKDPDKRFATSGELVRAARAAFGIRELFAVGNRRLLPVAAALGVVLALAAAAAAFALRDGADSALTLRENSLVRVDPKTNRVVAVVDVGDKPISVAAAGQRVWVYNLGDNSVSAIDARTNELLHTTPISTVPWNAAYYLGPLLAAGPSDVAWVVGVRDGIGIVTRIDSNGDKRETVLDRTHTPLAVAAAADAAWALGSVTPTNTCYGVEGVKVPPTRSDTVFRLSSTTGAITSRVRLPTSCSSAYGGVSARGRWVWTFDFSTSTLVRVDARTSRISGSADLGSDPFGPGGSTPTVGDDSVWVHAAGLRVIEVDSRTLRVIGGIPSSPAREGSAQFGDGSLWWNDIREGTLVRFDPETGRIVTSVRVAPAGARDDFHSTAIAVGSGDVWATVSRAFIDPQVP